MQHNAKSAVLALFFLLLFVAADFTSGLRASSSGPVTLADSLLLCSRHTCTAVRYPWVHVPVQYVLLLGCPPQTLQTGPSSLGLTIVVLLLVQ